MTNETSTTVGRERYYGNAASWAHDRDSAMRASRRLAWIIASVLGVIALVEGMALMLLAPLKTVIPYTLLVDRQTGYVEALKPLETSRIAGDKALTQSFLVQYVIAREGFDRGTLQADYRKVALWSSGAARRDYIASMQAGDPRSPLGRYPATTTINVRVKSVSSLGNGVALIRFATERVDGGGPPRRQGDWAAVVRYRFTAEPLKAEDRFINPLGFQVLRYRRDAEVVPEMPTSVSDRGPGDPAR